MPATVVPEARTTMDDMHRVRRELAAAHRLAVHHGLAEGTWNHLSHVAPDDSGHLLITPGYTHWRMVNATNLALVDDQGRLLEGERGPTRAGWLIHGPIHRMLPGAACLMHVHSPYAVAMSIREKRFDEQASQQAAQFTGDVAYYDLYDGVLDSEREGERMAKALGDRHVLLMRNHGVLIAAASVARAYLYLYQFERACMYELLADTEREPPIRIPQTIASRIGEGARGGRADLHFTAFVEMLDALEPDYRQ